MKNLHTQLNPLSFLSRWKGGLPMWIAAMIFGGGLLLSSAVAESVPRTGRAWLPGAMVEVEVVEPVLQREWKTRLEDLVVEVKKVFSGPRSLQGVRIRVNPSKVSRFPPKRWCALGMSGISGQSVDAYPPGRSGLLWIFQRRELLTSSSGGEFSFPTGFSPRWEPVKGRLREEVERHLHREWKHTRSLMRKVKGLRGMQEDKIKQKVLSWIAHDNPALRKWAIATLIRVKGMRVFPWVESIRNSEHVPSGLDRLADTIQSCATWRRSGDPSEKTLSLPPMLGVEILTKEKWSGARNILNPPTLEEPGSVKILRVFSGSGYEAGEILSASTGNFLVGEKILSLPLDGEVAFEPQHVKPQFRFPPRGRWDGDRHLLSQSGDAVLSLDPFLPWLEKLSADPSPRAGDFLREAVEDAPFSVAKWALFMHGAPFDYEMLDVMKRRALPASSAGQKAGSLRDLLLYDYSMTLMYSIHWTRDVERARLVEHILKHPLADAREARLLYAFFVLSETGIDTAGPGTWKRWAKAARENTSWRKDRVPDRYKSQFDFTAWQFTFMESRATFDPVPGINYLLKRWAIPDHGHPGTTVWVNTWGAELARHLPLDSEQIDILRKALEERLSTQAPQPGSEEIEKRLRSIRRVSWEEILDRPSP